MAEPFLGEIRLFAGNFAITGWALCDGQILAISQNTALFSLLGTFYGGNGTSNFALPNMQGSVPMGTGQGPGLTDRVIGEQGGETSVTLNQSTLAAHTHTMQGRPVDGNTITPSSLTTLARPNPPANLFYKSAATNLVNMNPLAVTLAGGQGGGALPHNNIQPYLAISFLIALRGVFPARN